MVRPVQSLAFGEPGQPIGRWLETPEAIASGYHQTLKSRRC
ncbi:hypothetical protein [Coleofasciculus sp. FACHB-SPT9]|nr:hypothetical protein [Coleofasciculus sp. FACHB-SPT9]